MDGAIRATCQASFANTGPDDLLVTWPTPVWEHQAVHWIGDGSALWRVRVDLFAPDSESARVPATHQTLQHLLTETDGAARPWGDSAADQGRGIEGRPVVGLVFWVRANEVGQAASIAVETARRAGAESGVGPELYDVVVLPSTAVRHPGDRDPAYLPKPD